MSGQDWWGELGLVIAVTPAEALYGAQWRGRREDVLRGYVPTVFDGRLSLRDVCGRAEAEYASLRESCVAVPRVTGEGWWSGLGLEIDSSPLEKMYAPGRAAVRVAVLRAHAPIEFDGGLSFSDVKTRVAADLEGLLVGRPVVRPVDLSRVPGAEDLITAGRWAGFTRRAALEWCWALVEYEPDLLAGVGSRWMGQVVEQLQAGVPVAVPAFVERVRELEAEGLTPQSYRAGRRAAGARSFLLDA